jgi:hypothetical protein
MSLKTLGFPEHNQEQEWEVRFHAEFLAEFRHFSEAVQDATFAQLIKLRRFGPQLGRPDVDNLKGSRYPNMKELRFSVVNEVWRVAFVFDPQRKAILLVGGSKSGIAEDRFYKHLIRKADARFQQHLAQIARRKETK